MNEFPEDAKEEAEVDDASEDADPPRPVRGILWLFTPGVVGAAFGAIWSAYYSALRGVDPAAPVLVGGCVGLAVGAFLWVFFPYKARGRS